MIIYGLFKTQNCHFMTVRYGVISKLFLMLVGALYRSMNKVLAKVSQLSRAYPVNVLAFDKVHPQWKTSSKSRGIP